MYILPIQSTAYYKSRSVVKSNNIANPQRVKSPTFGRYNQMLTPRYKVHILDGGSHGKYMEYFSKSVFNGLKADINVIPHNIAINSKDKNLKQMEDLEGALKDLNESYSIRAGEYLSIPGLASVSLHNLQDRIKNVLGLEIELTPKNVKQYKSTIMAMLKRLYDYPATYGKEIADMDSAGQNFGKLYGVITQINELVKKGVNVYVPAGHPEDNSIKWLAKQKDMKTQLYNYIASDKKYYAAYIENLFDEVRSKGWYDFNLLSLTDANIVNVNDKYGAPYLFAAYDSCVTTSARGVYNFYPVRDNGKVVGYSFHNNWSIDFPYSAFPENKSIENLNQFVGLRLSDVHSGFFQGLRVERRLKNGLDVSDDADKLYSIGTVFPSREIDKNKYYNLGQYTDVKGSAVYTQNNAGEVVFIKCDCEGSERPSVKTMWGTCFATFNAIRKDMEERISAECKEHDMVEKYDELMSKDYGCNQMKGAEYYCNKILDKLHPDKSSIVHKAFTAHYYEKLINIMEHTATPAQRKQVINTFINISSEDALYNKNDPDAGFLNEPFRRIGYWYKCLSDYCKNENRPFEAKVCQWAANQISEQTEAGYLILERRVKMQEDIGDLYRAYNKD